MESKWLTSALNSSCDSKSELWSALLSKISEDGNEIIRRKYGHQRFSKLSLHEQASIIEGIFFEVTRHQLIALITVVLLPSQ